jgi:hypothetical protein
VDSLGLRPGLVAGLLSGVAGLLTFLALHALWILPIWFILPLGLVLAGTGGLAVGWAYGELWPRLPRRPWTALALTALIVFILGPAMLLAELRPPLFVEIGGAGVLTVSAAALAAHFVLELLVSASLAGALAGWWVGRTRRAAAAVALAGLIFALGPGHNIPFIGGTSGLGKELALMGAMIVVSALVLVEAHAWLAGKRKQYAR